MKLTAEKTDRIEVVGKSFASVEKVLSPEALDFIASLHRSFNERRKTLLKARQDRLTQIKNGEPLMFPIVTKSIRETDWEVADIPADLQDRRTEITGPVDRKMIINALNSGAKVFMADFEDATSPTWENVISGQVNLFDAIRKQVDFVTAQGKSYELNDEVAVLKVRPRGWHLEEKNVLIDGERMSASLFDFGLYFFHNAKELLKRDSGPYFYLPKLESRFEAQLWNDVFVEAQKMLGIPNGTIKVTVLIETITAAFEMEEILYELKDHIAALNAGRWDYIFSAIKKFNDQILPDRGSVTMNVPFMDAYARLLVQVCHKRNAHAIGGMAAFIPSKDAEVNRYALTKVRSDKEREANIGYDGTWVAHPKLVPVAMEVFDEKLAYRAHQKDELLSDQEIKSGDLLNFEIPGGKVTEEGVRQNIHVAILYIASWLKGTGAAALYNLMEDAATAEISRAQVWQWLHYNVKLADGREMTDAIYEELLKSETERILEMVGEEEYVKGKYAKAKELFDEMVRKDQFDEFLTLNAYEFI
ncbi:MAG: malate synthase A [Bacteroidota bacterium]